MKKVIETKYGITVESTILNEEVELERARLKELAMQEYEDTGSLSSQRLLEANEVFLNKAKRHVLDEAMSAGQEDD